MFLDKLKTGDRFIFHPATQFVRCFIQDDTRSWGDPMIVWTKGFDGGCYWDKNRDGCVFHGVSERVIKV